MYILVIISLNGKFDWLNIYVWYEERYGRQPKATWQTPSK